MIKSNMPGKPVVGAGANKMNVAIIYSPNDKTEANAVWLSACHQVVEALAEAGIYLTFFTREESRSLLTNNIEVVHIIGEVSNPEIQFFTAQWPTLRSIIALSLFCPVETRFLPHSKQPCPHASSLNCLAVHMAESCIQLSRQPLSFYQGFKRLWHIQSSRVQEDSLSGYVVESSFMRALLIQHGYDGRRIHVLPPGFSIKPEAEMTPYPSEQPTVLLYQGDVSRESGFFDLVQALLLMPEKPRLIVAGDGPERATLENDIVALGLSDCVVFKPDLSDEAVSLLYQQCHGVVLPCLTPPPLGVAGLQAFRYRRPVVAYENGGVTDWLRHQQNGWVVKTGDIAGLAKAIMQLQQGPYLAMQMGEAGYQLMHERYSLTAFARGLKAVYNNVFNRVANVPNLEVFQS